MAVDKKFGVLITFQEGISDGMKKAGKAATQGTKFIRQGAEKATQAIKSTAIAAAVMNQALELGKKVFEFLRMAVFDTVEVMRGFRSENDKMLKQYDKMAQGAQLLRARLGDILLPILVGMGKAMNQLGGNTEGWLKTNRKLIASGLAEFLFKVANVLNTGIANGVILVAKVFTGWKVLIAGVQIAANTMFELMLKHLAKSLGAFKFLADAVGMDGLAGKLDSAQMAVKGLGDEFANSAEKNKESIQSDMAALDALEKKTKETQASIAGALVVGQKIVAEQIAKSSASSIRFSEDQKIKAQELADLKTHIAQEAAQLWAQELQRRDQAEEAAKQKQIARNMELFRSVQEYGNIWGDVLVGIASGNEDAGKLIIKAGISTAKKLIQAYAFSAAAGSASSQSAIPVVGPALAVTAASTMLALVEAYLSKFAAGGEVKGGIQGRDSVPALLTPGEIVLPVTMAKQFKQMFGGQAPTQGPLQFAGGGMVPQMAGGGGMVVNVSVPTVHLGSENEKRRLIHNLAPAIEDAMKRGRIRSK